MRTPWPPQTRHGVENENMPWLSSTTPRPPQAEHIDGEVPGLAPDPLQVAHCASVVRNSVVVMPLTESLKSTVSCAVMSAPRRGPTPDEAPPRPRPWPPRPNMFPNMSPRPPPPMSSTLNVKPPAPGPPRPPIGPMVRTSSYSLRLASSPSTSYADATSLNFSSATALPGFLSGCRSRASLRYALVISLAVELGSTPSVL